MRNDPVYEAFLETVAEDAAESIAASDILSLRPRPGAGSFADTYEGCLVGLEHLEPAGHGTARPSDAPVLFTLHFPHDYCRSTDEKLQFRVASVHTPLWHPNVRSGTVCLGPYFRPATRLRPLLIQLHGIVSGRVRATEHFFDPEAARYFLAHPEQVRALRARPLWRRAAGRGRLERLGGAA